MTSVGALAVLLFLSFGPNGWQVEARHLEADALEQRLVPMDWLGDTPRGLWIVVEPEVSRSALFVAPGSAESVFLPPPHVPRIVLDRAVHLRSLPGGDAEALAERTQGSQWTGGTEWTRLSHLALDSAEHYYRALLDAHAALSLADDPAWRQAVSRRSDAAMPGVPEAHRATAFREASLEFASHILSVGHEIGRHVRRRPPGALCRALAHPATLFGLWSRAHGGAPFVGGWWQPADEDSGRPGAWRVASTGLRPDDKRWIVRDLLGAPWTGDPREDFAFLCPGSAS